MYKDGVSLPGISARLNVKLLPAHIFFPYFNYKSQHLYWQVRQAIVGGPSIIFHRYDEADKTEITGQKVKSVMGYDAAALYLGSLMKAQPAGIFAEWTPRKPRDDEDLTRLIDELVRVKQ